MLECFFKNCINIIVCINAKSLNAESLGNCGEIGFSVRIGIRKAIALEKFLPLTNHTQNGIVHNKHFNRHIV